MENFPFHGRELLTVKEFISYGESKGIKISEAYLEFLHEKGLVYPCLRVKSGVSTLRKVIIGGNEQFIYADRLKEEKYEKLYKQKYYLPYTRFDHYPVGTDFPINDKKFIPWKTYKLKAKEYFESKSELSSHKLLFYSQKQLLLVKFIQKWRDYNFTFTQTPSKQILEQITETSKIHFDRFDSNFKKEIYPKFIKFFEFYLELQKNSINTYKKLNKKGVDELSDESFRLMKVEENQKINLEKLQDKYDSEFINNVKEEILSLAIPNHEDLNLYKLIETKENLSKFQMKGKIGFINDFIILNNLVNDYFKKVGFKDFVSVEKLYLGIDSLKYCSECGRSFVPNKFKQKVAKTCEDSICRKSYKNKLKKNKRKATRNK